MRQRRGEEVARVLSHEVTGKRKASPRIGGALLDVITTGMYSDPLMVYREYVQNSADSIQTAVDMGVLSPSDGTVRFEVSGSERTISIEDNGLGVTNSEAARALGSVGVSEKKGISQRGFRGIGRLGGLAYCDTLRFETRAGAEQLVAVVEWDGRKARELLEELERDDTLTNRVRSIVSTRFVPAGSDDPARFFRVTMRNVQRFHADELMNVKMIRSYLAQVAPVAYDENMFSHAKVIMQRLLEIPGYQAVNITVNGEPVMRPYRDWVLTSGNKETTIKSIEDFEIEGARGDQLAWGWYASFEYAGALPISEPTRGIRVRQGNMEVGDERALTSMYTEPRFAVWHVGEIHIANGAVRQNARRDGFERSGEYEAYLQQLSLLGRHLSRLCRESSVRRSSRARLQRTLDDFWHLTSNKLFIDASHQSEVINTAHELRKVATELAGTAEIDEDTSRRLRVMQRRLSRLERSSVRLYDELDGRTLSRASGKALLGDIARVVQESYYETRSPEDMVMKIMMPYLKGTKRRRT